MSDFLESCDDFVDFTSNNGFLSVLKYQSVYEFICKVVSSNEINPALLNGEACLDLICKIILKTNNRLLSIIFSLCGNEMR